MRETLSACYSFNHFVLTRNLEGFDEELARRSPEGGGNSANWLLGHILYSRSQLLHFLGSSAPLDPDRDKAYSRGSQPESNPPRPLADLQQALEDSQSGLMELFGALPEKTLLQQVSLGPIQEQPLHRALVLFSLHESYHAGQIGSLRSRLGLDGALR